MKFQAILTIEAALEAVERNGYALRYVKEQTENVCLKAVESDGYALQYVKERTVFMKLLKLKKLIPLKCSVKVGRLS